MPVTYPHYDPDTDQLVDHTYYTTEEVGNMLHLHPNTVRSRIRLGVWDALKVGRNRYMDAAQIGAAIESMRTHAVGELDDTPPKLGRVLDDPDTESIR